MKKFLKRIFGVFAIVGVGALIGLDLSYAEGLVARQASLQTLIEEAMRKNPGLQAKKKDYEAK